MANLTHLVDKDGMIHVYYWGNSAPTSYPDGGYGSHQYQDKPWSVCVDGTDGVDVLPTSVYTGIGDAEDVSVDETGAPRVKIAVANGIVGTTHQFKIEYGGQSIVSGPIRAGAWHEFDVALGSDPVDYHISVVNGDDPKFRIRYKSG